MEEGRDDRGDADGSDADVRQEWISVPDWPCLGKHTNTGGRSAWQRGGGSAARPGSSQRMGVGDHKWGREEIRGARTTTTAKRSAYPAQPRVQTERVPSSAAGSNGTHTQLSRGFKRNTSASAVQRGHQTGQDRAATDLRPQLGGLQ